MKDEDEVEQEIPVYFSNNLANKLFIFQYPIELGSMNLDERPVISTSIKPMNGEVKLELKLDTASNNYDETKAERIASSTNGPQSTDLSKPSEKYFSRNVMDKVKLESKHAVQDASHYAVGVWHDDELHLSPISSILHLRKSFSYIDLADKQAKAAAKEQGLGEDNSGDEDEEEAKQVTVKFARQETDRFKQARERSFKFASKKSAEEAWVHTEYHNSKSSLAQKEKLRMFCSKKTDVAVDVLTFEQQLKHLNIHGVGTSEHKSMSLYDLKKLPLIDQVRNLLKKVNIICFERLAQVLHIEDRAQLLRAVQQVAVLVQGNWAVRSEIIFKSSENQTKVPPTHVSPDMLCRGRDYILMLYTKKRYIDRAKVSDKVKIPSEIISNILSCFAIFIRNKGWEILLPYDKDFVNKYPEIVQRQTLQWELKEKQLIEALKESQVSPNKSRRKSSRDSSVSDGDANVESPRRKHRRKSQSFSLSSDNESGTESGSKRNNVASHVGKTKIKTEAKDS